MTSPDSPDGPTVFAAMVTELVAAEDRRRESLETRGNSVITVSGTLVTLLVGLGAVVSGKDAFKVPAAARQWLSFAVVAFVVATLLAIATYAPRPTRVTDATELSRLLPTFWNQGTDFALKKTTATRLEQLRSAQAANDRRARLLLGAVAAQVAAVIFLAWAVLTIL